MVPGERRVGRPGPARGQAAGKWVGEGLSTTTYPEEASNAVSQCDHVNKTGWTVGVTQTERCLA